MPRASRYGLADLDPLPAGGLCDVTFTAQRLRPALHRLQLRAVLRQTDCHAEAWRCLSEQPDGRIAQGAPFFATTALAQWRDGVCLPDYVAPVTAERLVAQA